MNFKEKIYLYVNSTQPQGVKKNNENFSDQRFFLFTTGVINGAPCAANVSVNFEKIQNGPYGILRGLEETDS